MATQRPALAPAAGLLTGQFLKKIRQRLRMRLREVQAASAILAAEEKNEQLYISAARLFQIENEISAPGPFKMFTLCVIYGLDFLDLLRRYGVDPDRVHYCRSRLPLSATRKVSAKTHSPDTMVKFPLRMDPRFRWETTQLINRAVAVWGEIPAAFLAHLNPREHIWGYIGMEDFTMYPILRPGTLVMVDDRRRRVIQKDWENQYERPIYFVELRDGYACAWCQLEGKTLTLIPNPMSPVPAQSFNYPDDADIVGQVVGIAMRMVPVAESDPEPAPEP